jgi:hypothetical protein
MASLSNINGIFDVHSTGAILFSTSHGTSGQILRSNGNAAPTWVDASTVIGGPYLPLTGGTLTGPLAGTSATFSGTVTANQFISTNNGNGTNYRIGDDVWIGDINIANTFRVQGVQDSSQGYITFGSNNTQLGRSGTGALTWGGDASFTGNVSIGVYASANTGSLLLNGSTANRQSVLKCTNGNLHIDADSTYVTYINYYTGSGGITFGNGAGAASGAAVSSTGIIYATGGNSGIWNTHTSNTGTVTSVATGNGLTGGTITTTGTLSLDRPNSALGAVLATYGTTAGSAGRIRCTAPFNTNTGKMFSIEITLYSSYTQHNYVVSAYMYSTTNQWYAPKAIYTTNGTATPDIYVGRDASGKAYISIANASYTGVLVHNMTRGYQTSLADTYDPWTIAVNSGNENSVSVATSQVWTTANHTPGNYLPLAGGIMSGNIGRSAYDSGYQVGGFNNIGASHTNTNPIHVIGTSYEPTATGLSNMYGIGYTRGDASFLTGTSGWGMYVAADGNSRIFLDGQNGGIGTANNSWRAPIFYDTNTAYYGDFAGTSRMSRINAGNGNSPAFVCVANASYPSGTELEIGGWSTTTTVSKIRNSNGNLHIDSKSGHSLYLNHYPPGNILVGNGGGYLLAYQSMRSPIFYDSNNTGYYVHPDGTSNLNAISFNGGTLSGTLTMNTQKALVANNYGRGVYGLYSASRFQHLWSMGTAYNLADNGTSTGNLYGMAWSHPNAGGVAANLSNHGQLLLLNGGYQAAISGSIRCVTDMRTPIYYDSNNTGYYGNFASTSILNALQFNYTQHGSANNIRMGNSTTMNAISSGTNNAAFGVEALGGCSTGSRNFAYGYASLFSLSSGGSNIAMGDATGYNVTSGSNNLLFGQNAGRTGYQSPYQSIAGVTSGSNQIHMGNESHSTARIQISWTVNSDSRDKTDVTPIDVGLDFVKDLNPVTFRWDKRSDYEDRIPTGQNKLEELTLGFLAQEVEEVEKSYGYNVANKTNLVVDRDVDQDHFGITYEKMIPILTKAIQEQQVIIDDLKSRIEKLEL